MSGKSYSNLDPIPFDDIRYLARRLAERPISTHILAVLVVPMIANVLLFVPWGFLTFIALYNTSSVPRCRRTCSPSSSAFRSRSASRGGSTFFPPAWPTSTT